MTHFLSLKELSKSISFWLAIAIFIFLFEPPFGPLSVKITGTCVIVLSYSYVYYSQLYFIFRLFYKNIWLLLLFTMLNFSVFIFGDFLIFNKFLDNYSTYKSYTETPWFDLIVSELSLFLFITVVALGRYQSELGVKTLKLKNQKERVLRLKELELLRNHFNSHITFDFLRQCQNIIQNNSPETAKVIEIFTRMLQYSLNTSALEKEPLSKEIEYLNDFILLQKLLSSDVMVDLSIDGKELNTISIFPRILIGSVENAFKHGDLHSQDYPISIKLNASSEQINFTVSNGKNKHKVVESSGVGNHNLKQQLELLYKNKYKIHIDDQEDIYICEIKLLLN